MPSIFHYTIKLLFVLIFCLSEIRQVSATTLTTADCRACHGGNVSSRHHLLLGLTEHLCYDCHLLSWDPALSAFVFNDSRECKTCHAATLADRHHILLQHADFECFSCHAVQFDAATQSFYLNLDYAASREQISHYFNHIMTPNNCSGCHLDNLIDEHDKKCNYCHNSTDPTVQAAVTAGYRNCTACHFSTFKHVLQCAICHTPPPAPTSDVATLHRRHMHRVNCGYCHMIRDTYNLSSAGAHCAICHTVARPYNIADVPMLHRTHVKGRGFYPYSCYMCHGKNAPQMHPNQCCVCHEDGRSYGSDTLETLHRAHNQWFDCTNCHFDPMDYMHYTKFESCDRCHDYRAYPSVFSLHGLSHKDKPCWACHPADELLAKRSVFPTGCLSCHPTLPSYPNPQWVHIRHNGYQCWACHDAVYPICPTMKQPLNAASGRVEGLVTDSQGNPLKAVRVFTQNGEYLTRTGADGGYTLHYIPPGFYRIIAESSGYATQNQQLKIRDGYSSQVNFILNAVAPDSAIITGRATDAGQNALSGAMVQAVGSAYTAITAPDGAYALTAISPGAYTVEVVKIGFENSVKLVTTSAGQSSLLDFVMTSVPQDVLCNSCHGMELGSKISCSSKTWRKHLKENRVTKVDYEKAEITFLGQACGSIGYAMSTAAYEQSAPPASSSDLVLCTTCHGDNSDKMTCKNKKWRVHLRKKRIDRVIFNLAETTHLGEKCN